MNKFLVLALIIAVGSSCNRMTVKPNDRPNIIFILTDDQRFDALGYAGNQLISTPEMDALATEGVYFNNAIVTTPICAASRASILTGLYERSHTYDFSAQSIRSEHMAISYPRILKNNGYQTGFYGKYGVRYDSLGKQFDKYESYDRNGNFNDRRGYYYKTLGKDTVHLTRYTGQKALDFIESATSDTPFCLSLSFSAPHAHDPAEDQYFWQEESNALLQDITMPGPELGSDEYFNAQPPFVRDGFNRLRWHWRYDSPEKYQHSVKGYYRMISGIDREIGKIREQLKRKGLDKNTVIILMGDNGYFLGERQLAGKWLLYDNSIRVPLIIYDPRVKIHRDISEMVLNVDVPATILDLAGLHRPLSWHGNSLMPLVEHQKNAKVRDTVLIEHIWEFESIPPSEGVRTKDWKYFRYVNDKSYEELYHLSADVKEINNLARLPEYRTVLEKLRKKCDALIKEYSDGFADGPTDLVVEHNDKPTFGWSLHKGIINQSAYQVLIASSEEKCHNNVGDIWNSGRVEGQGHSDIQASSGVLKEGVPYFWKVRVWDEENRLSRYSDPGMISK